MASTGSASWFSCYVQASQEGLLACFELLPPTARSVLSPSWVPQKLQTGKLRSHVASCLFSRLPFSHCIHLNKPFALKKKKQKTITWQLSVVPSTSVLVNERVICITGLQLT